MISREFNLYLHAGHSIPLVINCNQYDHGEQWLFTLYNSDGTKYVPSSGAIVGIKSDNLGIINSGSVDSDGRVVINETQQMTAAVGKAVFELLIDDQTHGTANFIVLVEPKPGDNADLSESDLSLIQQAIDGTSAAAIAQGVSDWMDENLTPTTPVVDQSLTVQGAAADSKKVGDELNDLKSQITQIGSGIPTEVKRAMDTLFQNMTLNDYDGSSEFATIHAWATAIHVVSISATVEQGTDEIYLNTPLGDLKKYLTVTAYFDDSTYAEVDSYALSGTLVVGSSELTVSYGGKTATVSVTVTNGYDITPDMSNIQTYTNTTYSYDSSTGALYVKSTSNGTARAVAIGEVTVEANSLYTISFDVNYVKGSAVGGFRRKTSPLTLYTDGGYLKESGHYVGSADLIDRGESVGNSLYIYIGVTSMSTSEAGEATFSNIKVIRYVTE